MFVVTKKLTQKEIIQILSLDLPSARSPGVQIFSVFRLRECLGTNREITRDCPSSAHFLSSSLHVKHLMIQRCVITNAALVS